ncbi:SH3 domain-containing protein [Aureimonas sp. AU40]|uniref:SH3 domain-containing protein n=1 Tax=Aureimonas sp. AU40 TaxID=1637747 RepID=UPI0007817A3D|nr:SH3 domain-containing protein [Aureimonas sp. AU40]
MGKTFAALIAVGAVTLAAPAFAQSESDFVKAFSGEWQTLDPALSAGGACQVALQTAPSEGSYQLQTSHCGGALSGLSKWKIVDNQLGFLSADGAILARLGGNQNRVSGQLANGSTVVLERLAPGSAASAAAVTTGRNGCVFYGYTASCAKSEARQSPMPSGSDEKARASVLVQLNARAEARPDAPVVATIPAGTCVVIDQCTTASDGNWCRASISNFSGWIRQQAMRGNRWPVLTYAPGCASPQAQR